MEVLLSKKQKKLNVAFIYCNSNVTMEPCRGDLTMLFQKMEASPDVDYSIVAWDDPNTNWSSYSHLILTAQAEYAPRIDKFLAWLDDMESIGKTFWNPLPIIRWNANKRYLRELEAKKLRVPPTVWIDKRHEDLLHTPEVILRSLAGDDERRREYPLQEIVVKNVIDASGATTWKCPLRCSADDDAAIPAWALDKMRGQVAAAEDGVMVQTFLPSILSEGEWSLLYFDMQFSHAVIKKPDLAAGEFRVQESFGGLFYPIPRDLVPSSMIELGCEALASIPLQDRVLFARVDIVRNADGAPCLMELEVLDAFLYITEPQQAQQLLEVMLRRG